MARRISIAGQTELLEVVSTRCGGATRWERYDANKKTVGRKRHIAVNTDGRLLMVNLTKADISNSAGAQHILDAIRKRWPWLKHFFADGACDRGKQMDKAAFLNFTVEVIKRITGEPGLKVLPDGGWWNAHSAGWSAGAASCVITSDASTSPKV